MKLQAQLKFQQIISVVSKCSIISIHFHVHQFGLWKSGLCPSLGLDVHLNSYSEPVLRTSDINWLRCFWLQDEADDDAAKS